MYRFIFVTLLWALASCSDYLDVKPDKSLVVPQTLKDLRGLLDNSVLMNGSHSTLSVIGSDNFFVEPETWQSLVVLPEKNAYVWNEDIYESDINIMDWKYPYQQIYNTNLVLETLDKIERTSINAIEYDELQGSAYFCRAWAYYQLAQLFCKTYDARTSDVDLGLPLKLESDINIQPRRSSVAITYMQIVGDLKNALELLSAKSETKTRPSQQAAYALMARTLLVMDDFDNAYLYADSALTIDNELLDLNIMDANEEFPFIRFNREVIFHTAMVSSTILHPRNLQVDPSLYGLYEENDLRKHIFFTMGNNGSPTFKGSYNGDRFLFAGLSTNELYLIKAECAVRTGKIEEANASLNTLLKNRYPEGWEEINETERNRLLDIILRERRKELPFRGIRWSDLRRLNKHHDHAITLTRQMGDQTFMLEPNSERYVLPIPDIVIELSGIRQNPR